MVKLNFCVPDGNTKQPPIFGTTNEGRSGDPGPGFGAQRRLADSQTRRVSESPSPKQPSAAPIRGAIWRGVLVWTDNLFHAVSYSMHCPEPWHVALGESKFGDSTSTVDCYLVFSCQSTDQPHVTSPTAAHRYSPTDIGVYRLPITECGCPDGGQVFRMQQSDPRPEGPPMENGRENHLAASQNERSSDRTSPEALTEYRFLSRPRHRGGPPAAARACQGLPLLPDGPQPPAKAHDHHRSALHTAATKNSGAR